MVFSFADIECDEFLFSALASISVVIDLSYTKVIPLLAYTQKLFHRSCHQYLELSDGVC